MKNTIKIGKNLGYDLWGNLSDIRNLSYDHNLRNEFWDKLWDELLDNFSDKISDNLKEIKYEKAN